MKKKSAFTLIELLVVISIILIASSIIFIGGSGGDGAKLSSAQRIVSGIAQGARGQAILKSAKSRLIIYSDDASNEDDEKKLRFFGIIYQELNQEGDPTGGWYAATQGTYLSEGIYFNPGLSEKSERGSWTKSNMKIDYPRAIAKNGGSGEDYYYYEFKSNGTMASGFDDNDWLVLQAGALRPDPGGTLKVDFSETKNEGLKAALIFRRVGTTTLVKDPLDIIAP
jgi:prepilin-type N-terminal cleavage/methylation domain-containing protein